MPKRFQGSEGLQNLHNELSNQTIFNGDENLITLACELGELCEHQPRIPIIREGDTDNDIYLIISGTVDIVTSNRVLAQRTSGQHFGEMALIDVSAFRCANVIAHDTVITCSLSESNFTKMAQANPQLWRRLALEVSDNLRKKNTTEEAEPAFQNEKEAERKFQEKRKNSYWGIEASELVRNPAENQPKPAEISLSPRLRSVAELSSQGLSRKEVASELGLSIHTLNGYMKQIFNIFEVNNQVELVLEYKKYTQ